MSVLAADPPARAASALRQRFYRPELDVLRFIAFLGVYLHHTLPKDRAFYEQHHVLMIVRHMVAAGALGVQLFFCLSAYLITELLLREKERNGALDVKHFYLRRILRIWPLYFLVLGLAWALQFVFTEQHFDLLHVAAYLALLGNWSNVLISVPESVALPLWSVSVEEQFYLLWPAFIRKARRNATLIAATLMLATGFVSRVLVAHFSRNPDVFIWNSTITQLDPIACGILAAVLLNHRIPRIPSIARVGMMVLGFSAWIFSAMIGNHYNSSMPLATLGSVLLLFAFLGWNLSMFHNSGLIKLGIVSYGLYAYHQIVLLLWRSVIPWKVNSPLRFAGFWFVGLALTICVALISYRWFETPFLRMKERFAVIASRPV
jgi:peptidoglycan/LPS O-acetylase OafA/YrhL